MSFAQEFIETLVLIVGQLEKRFFGINQSQPSTSQVGAEESDRKEQEQCRPQPQQKRIPLERWLQQDEVPIACDDECQSLLIAISALQSLAHQDAKIARQRRSRIVDRLVLAYDAA